MAKRTLLFVLLTAVCAARPLFAQDEEVRLPALEVVGQPIEHPGTNPERVPFATPDTAGLLRRAPGAHVNVNGPITGMAQYRGMFGQRLNVRLNGTPIEPGGPNWMDPPLQYMPRSLVESINVTRGVAPVSSGSGIGGSIEVKEKSSRFTDGKKFEFHNDVEFSGHSADSGYNLGGVLSLANKHHRLHFIGSRDDGDDTRFGDGTIEGTEYERNTYGAGYGFKIGGHEFGLDYQRLDVNDTGTPGLPMDINFTETDRLNGNYAGVWNAIKFKAGVYYSNVDHRMNNFSLRQAPNFCQLPAPFCAGADKRLVNADSDTFGYSVQANLALWGGSLTIGADGQLAEHDATVLDPDVAPFFVTNFNNARTNTYGFFGEWSKEFRRNWDLQIGVRYHRVTMDAGRVNAFPAQLADMGMGGMPARMVRTLRNRFNNANRDQTNNNVDWTAQLGYQMNPSLHWTFAVARKVRSPYYIERYLWIPLEVNAGLGDGNNYIGNVNLDPEVSRQVELGFDWRTQADTAYLSPRIYYRRVNDYIQGTPVTDPVVIGVSGNAAGDSTPLQFSNVDAAIYGFDADFGYRFHPQWRIDGVASYVRGKRHDINDNLYRIAPPTLRLALTHERAQWFATLEGVFVYRQEHISKTNTRDPQNPNNSDNEIPGYVLANLYGQYRFPDQGLSVTAGINNLLDKSYINPLGGFNRVLSSDVAQGQRLPGAGRNFFASLRYKF